MTLKRTLRLIAGVSLIVLGVFGLVLPILQGILMIFAGLMVINPNIARKFISRFRKRPKYANQ